MCAIVLDSSNILRWLVIHNMRLHPHYHPPGKQFVVTAQEVFLRERAFYHLLYDLIRYVMFLALVLTMVNVMRHDYDIFLRNDSVYRQVFNDPQFQRVSSRHVVVPQSVCNLSFSHSSHALTYFYRNLLYIFIYLELCHVLNVDGCVR